ncbi:MAG: GNAT family N-acetyltransferase, partial [Lysobacteraceae bacterium]
MSVRNLEHFFSAQSIAVVGASARLGSVGATVLANLMSGGFQGKIWPVNPKYRQLEGLAVFPEIDTLPGCPDLAVICTPAATVPGIIASLGRRGCRAAEAGDDARYGG